MIEKRKQGLIEAAKDKLSEISSNIFLADEMNYCDYQTSQKIIERNWSLWPFSTLFSHETNASLMSLTHKYQIVTNASITRVPIGIASFFSGSWNIQLKNFTRRTPILKFKAIVEKQKLSSSVRCMKIFCGTFLITRRFISTCRKLKLWNKLGGLSTE